MFHAEEKVVLGGVVLDDHVRLHEPPGVDAVVPLRVLRGLGAARRPERDRLRDDRRPRRSDGRDEQHGEEDPHRPDGSVDSRLPSGGDGVGLSF